MTKKIDKTGEQFVSKEGYTFIIVKYNNANDLYVQFQDEHKAIVPSAYHKCKDGGIKNPYHPSVHGVGYLGLMSDGSRPNTVDNTKNGRHNSREYSLWNRIMTRCYSNYECWDTYKDAEVCDRWKCFSNFLEDLPLIEGYQFWLEHPNELIALDKDIKGNGSKIYCLENCCFVSKIDNTNEKNERCGLPKHNIKIYGINIKTGERTRDFNSITEASKAIGNTGVSNCIQGKSKTCGGYKWFKIEKESE